MAQPLSPIVVEFAKANGYREPASDESFDQIVVRTMKQFSLDREDAEVMVLDDQRDELEDFFFKRFKQPPSNQARR